ncbi:probable Bax inhibitor 1 [Asterias rubens]|uniref:probable Bax inhibitor 1 n=1 Tax=Asterias rubens TaxID=7604 RepID=UPI001454F6DC|nr:probable Bax inhibitor 1 [Asterias rubens]XP_033629404.1 probable Bax inhibitor 1 [Asterias rubens]
MDALFGQRKIKLSALSDFSQLNKTTRTHLKNVYSCLAICMLAAAVGAYVHLFTGILEAGFLTSIAGLGLLIWLGVTKDNGSNQGKRLGLLSGFAFFTGLSLGPLMYVVAKIDIQIIPTAFLATCVIFGCFTFAALWSDRRSFLFLGGTLFSGLSILMIMSLLNIFIGSTLIFRAEMYLCLAVFMGFVLFDTQLIVEKCNNGDKDYIWHSVDLFLDFINIFRQLMILLAMNNDKKEKRRK